MIAIATLDHTLSPLNTRVTEDVLVRQHFFI